MSERKDLKFAISYSRKVSTGQYESMEIGFWVERPLYEDPDAWFKTARDRVERWIRQRLREIEAEREPLIH